MEINRTILLILLLCISIFSFVSISKVESPYHNTHVKINSVKYSIESKTLYVDLDIYNMEEYPLPEQRVIIDVVKQYCDDISPHYPTQFYECENIVEEFVVKDIYLNAYEKINVKKEFKVELSEGVYRIDIYLSDHLTPSFGIHFIFHHGGVRGTSWELINVYSSNKRDIRILRTLTEFNGYKGPVGFPVNISERIVGNIYVESNQNLNGYLEILVCKWDDINCLTGIYTPFYYKKISIKINEGKNIYTVDFQAPSKPDAYAILIRIKDDYERTLSLYRSRVVVLGETVKIRKIVVSDLDLSKKFNVYIRVGASPDHYTRPSVENVELEVFIKDENNNIAKKWTQTIKELKSPEKIYDVFVFSSEGFNKRIDTFSICAKTKYDEECTIFNLKNYVSSNFPYDYEIKYLWINDTLQLKIYRTDDSYFVSHVVIFNEKDSILFSGDIDKDSILEFKDAFERLKIIVSDKNISKTFFVYNDRLQKNFGIFVANSQYDRHLIFVAVFILLVISVILIIVIYKRNKRIINR